MADIEIVGVDVDGVGKPRNDGTRGSALYLVPIKLSEEPSSIWVENALAIWRRPPSSTMMHRPDIASVVGDRFLLDGTDLEEVESTHAKTLKLVVERANQLTREAEERNRAEEEKLAAEESAHADHVETVAKRIKFD